MCDHVNLLEKDYFGLANWETPTNKVGIAPENPALKELGREHFVMFFFHYPQTWLEATKEIRKQVSGAVYEFTFNVKFYPPDPAQLTEDLTR